MYAFNLRSRLSALVEKTANVAIIISALLLLAFTTITISITVTNIFLSSGKQPPGFFDWITTTSISCLGINKLDLPGDSYKSYVITIKDVSIALLSLWLAFIPLFAIWKKRVELAKKSSFIVRPIHTDGEDDYKILIQYLKNAENVVLFSGNFSWLTKHQFFHQRVRELHNEGKIKLISYRTREEVINAIRDTAVVDELGNSFIFESRCKIKASFIRTLNKYVFLYKNTEEKKVVILRETEDSRYILKAINEFVQHISSE